jgi:outer membrane protein TolC
MNLRLAIVLTAALFFTPPVPAAEVRTARPVQRVVSGQLKLDEAVQLALRQNPDILKQLAEIERTRGLVVEARAEALPHLSLNANYDQQSKRLLENQTGSNSEARVPEIEIPVANGQVLNLGELFTATTQDRRMAPDKTWQVSLQVRQLLYAGGQVRAAINIAKFAEDSAYWALRDVIDRVVATTRAQFYTVLTNRSLITVAEETVRLQEDLLKDQKNRFEAGTVPRFNVLRAEVELANVVPTLIRAKNDYVIAQVELAKTLGLDPGPGGRPTFECVGELRVNDRPFDITQALDLAKARRPFLKVQRQQIKIEAENIKIALAGYKPRIEGSAGWLVRNSRLTDDIESTVDGWFFGFTGSWDIFDGLATHGRVTQAKAQLEAARVNYSDSVQQVELEVQTAYLNLRAQRETIRSQQKNVEQAREALRLAGERLAAGAGTQLEVLDARVALTRAQTTELVARGDYNKALAEFDRATAMDTNYAETFPDPLRKLEAKILAREAKAESQRAAKPTPGFAKKKP